MHYPAWHTDAARAQVQALVADRTVDAVTVVSAAQQTYRQVERHTHRLSGATPAVRQPNAAPTPTPAGPPPEQPPQPDHRRRR